MHACLRLPAILYISMYIIRSFINTGPYNEKFSAYNHDNKTWEKLLVMVFYLMRIFLNSKNCNFKKK